MPVGAILTEPAPPAPRRELAGDGGGWAGPCHAFDTAASTAAGNVILIPPCGCLALDGQCCSAADLQCSAGRTRAPLRFRMRICLVLIFLGALCACAEAVEGPRIVVYSPDRFYVRHLPWRDSRSSVERLAGAICEQVGKEATPRERLSVRPPRHPLRDVRLHRGRADGRCDVGGQRSDRERTNMPGQTSPVTNNGSSAA